jgi:hypothetical protein
LFFDIDVTIWGKEKIQICQESCLCIVIKNTLWSVHSISWDRKQIFLLGVSTFVHS